jgi:hypothetical protein
MRKNRKTICIKKLLTSNVIIIIIKDINKEYNFYRRPVSKCKVPQGVTRRNHAKDVI